MKQVHRISKLDKFQKWYCRAKLNVGGRKKLVHSEYPPKLHRVFLDLGRKKSPPPKCNKVNVPYTSNRHLRVGAKLCVFKHTHLCKALKWSYVFSKMYKTR